MIRDLQRIGSALRQDLSTLLDADACGGLSLRTAIAAVVAILLACALNLDEPAWAGITTVGITQIRLRATFVRALDRALGTIVGAVVGFIAAGFIDDHAVMTVVLVAGSAFTIYGQERSDHSYALLLGGVTMMLVLFGSLADPTASVDLAVYRVLEVLLGIAVSTAFEWSFADRQPGDQSTKSTLPGVWARPVDRELLALALTGGLAIAAIPIVWTAFNLPGLSQTPITAFVIVTAWHGNPVLKALGRMVGCIGGGLFGLLALRLAGDMLLWWAVLLLFGLYASARVKNTPNDASYAGHQAAIAIILSLVQGARPPADILPALDRLLGIFGGILIVAAFQFTLTPVVTKALAWLDGREPTAPSR